MCGRYALGININDLPAKIGDIYSSQVHSSNVTESEPNEAIQDRESTHNESNETEEIVNQQNNNEQNNYHHDHLQGSDSPQNTESNELRVLVAAGFDVSYNIPPTGTGVIIYQPKPQQFVVETSKFGVLPVWAKPGQNPKKEVGQHQAKYFNCRRETLEKPQSVWTSLRNRRCVVPISGYFEWLHSGKDKTPYYVTSKSSEKRNSNKQSPKDPKDQDVLFLAALYAHNTNFGGTEIGDRFSSFAIVTGPSHGSGSNDLSWLHSRKPIFLKPNTEAWHRWLDPGENWSEVVLGCLDTDTNPAYDELTWHQVTSSVGNLKNKGREVLEEPKQKQSSITSFFGKREGKEPMGTKRVKTEQPEKASEPKNLKKEEEKKTKDGEVKKEEVKKELKSEGKDRKYEITGSEDYYD